MEPVLLNMMVRLGRTNGLPSRCNLVRLDVSPMDGLETMYDGAEFRFGFNGIGI
jgi:hypothetical protein